MSPLIWATSPLWTSEVSCSNVFVTSKISSTPTMSTPTSNWTAIGCTQRKTVFMVAQQKACLKVRAACSTHSSICLIEPTPCKATSKERLKHSLWRSTVRTWPRTSICSRWWGFRMSWEWQRTAGKRRAISIHAINEARMFLDMECTKVWDLNYHQTNSRVPRPQALEVYRLPTNSW